MSTSVSFKMKIALSLLVAIVSFDIPRRNESTRTCAPTIMVSGHSFHLRRNQSTETCGRDSGLHKQ